MFARESKRELSPAVGILLRPGSWDCRREMRNYRFLAGFARFVPACRPGFLAWGFERVFG